MALFYLSEIYSRYHPSLLPDDLNELESYIVDDPKDQGVDFLYSHDSYHFICQFKYRKRGKNEDEKDVLYFSKVFERIHPEIGKNYDKNEKLSGLLGKVDFRKDSFKLLYITLGRSIDDIKELENKGITNIDHPDLRDIENRAEFRVLCEKKLSKEYKDTRHKEKLAKVELELSGSCDRSPWYRLDADNGKTSYISSIKAKQVYELYDKHASSLFNLNIRNYVGDTKTNKNIIDTATKEAENFFFYNNGISAVCSKVEESEKSNTLICKNFSVVNGGQTFRSIYKAYSKGKDEKQIDKLEVMIRVMEIPNLFDSNSDFIDNVTRYNNTQNSVKISDFRSNDGVQNSLSKRFEKISYGGKKYYYKNKRDKDNPKNTISVNLDDFCRTIHSFIKGPIDFFGGLSYLYDTGDDGGYFVLFGDEEENTLRDELDDKTFNYYSSIWFLIETSRDIFKEEKRKRSERETSTEKTSTRALDGKSNIVYTLGLIIEAVSKELKMSDKDFFFKYKFHDPSKWRKDEKIKNFLEDVVVLACDVLVDVYQVASFNAGEGFVYRNWFRQKTTLDNLRRKVENASDSNIRRLAESIKD